jgi:hypothetical protein
MVLGEAYLRGILRPPPTSAAALPPNPPHPFQQSFAFYVRQRFMKHHVALVVGYGITIWAFLNIDKARNGAQKANYDKAVSEGHVPCELCVRGARGSTLVVSCIRCSRGVPQAGVCVPAAAPGGPGDSSKRPTHRVAAQSTACVAPCTRRRTVSSERWCLDPTPAIPISMLADTSAVLRACCSAACSRPPLKHCWGCQRDTTARCARRRRLQRCGWLDGLSGSSSGGTTGVQLACSWRAAAANSSQQRRRMQSDVAAGAKRTTARRVPARHW